MVLARTAPPSSTLCSSLDRVNEQI